MRAVLCLLLLQGGDEFAQGMRAYEQGSYRDALTAFGAAERAAGDAASAELLHNKAMAALRSGELRLAELTAERAVARAGPRLAAWRDFVLGNVAFQRCEAAQAQAQTIEAEPFAFDAAIALAERARWSWQLAAVSRDDWPQARRNVERAMHKLEELRRQKAAAAAAKARRVAEPVPRPVEPPATAAGTETQEGQAEAQTTRLSGEQVLRLFEKLDQKEKEKRRLREARTLLRGSEVEKDW
jgi:hypothetical protein